MESKYNTSLHEILEDINNIFLLDCSIDDARRISKVLRHTSKKYIVRKHDESMATYKVFNMTTLVDDIYRESMLLPLLHNSRYSKHFVKGSEIVDFFLNIRTPVSMRKQRKRLFLHSEYNSQSELTKRLDTSWEQSQKSDDCKDLVHVVLRQHANGKGCDAFFRQPGDKNTYRKRTTVVKAACRFMSAFVVPTQGTPCSETPAPDKMSIPQQTDTDGVETTVVKNDECETNGSKPVDAELNPSSSSDDTTASAEQGGVPQMDASEMHESCCDTIEVNDGALNGIDGSVGTMANVEAIQSKCKDKLALLSEML